MELMIFSNLPRFIPSSYSLATSSPGRCFFFPIARESSGISSSIVKVPMRNSVLFYHIPWDSQAVAGVPSWNTAAAESPTPVAVTGGNTFFSWCKGPKREQSHWSAEIPLILGDTASVLPLFFNVV